MEWIYHGSKEWNRYAMEVKKEWNGYTMEVKKEWNGYTMEVRCGIDMQWK